MRLSGGGGGKQNSPSERKSRNTINVTKIQQVQNIIRKYVGLYEACSMKTEHNHITAMSLCGLSYFWFKYVGSDHVLIGLLTYLDFVPPVCCGTLVTSFFHRLRSLAIQLSLLLSTWLTLLDLHWKCPSGLLWSFLFLFARDRFPIHGYTCRPFLWYRHSMCPRFNLLTFTVSDRGCNIALFRTS